MVTVTLGAVANMVWRLVAYNTAPVTPLGIMLLSIIAAVLVAVGATFGGGRCPTRMSWGRSLSRKDPEMTEQRPPFPPFDEQSALQKVQSAEDVWNSCDPEKVALGYSDDSVWRNRNSFVTGREQILVLLQDKWLRELDYALRKQLWSFAGNRIAVRYQYESHDPEGQWWRSYGNELWEYDENGLNCRRESSINDIKITRVERKIFGTRAEADHGKDVIGLQ